MAATIPITKDETQNNFVVLFLIVLPNLHILLYLSKVTDNNIKDEVMSDAPSKPFRTLQAATDENVIGFRRSNISVGIPIKQVIKSCTERQMMKRSLENFLILRPKIYKTIIFPNTPKNIQSARTAIKDVYQEAIMLFNASKLSSIAMVFSVPSFL